MLILDSLFKRGQNLKSDLKSDSSDLKNLKFCGVEGREIFFFPDELALCRSQEWKRSGKEVTRCSIGVLKAGFLNGTSEEKAEDQNSLLQICRF